MQNSSDLLNMLRSIHRKSYPAYKSLRGVYRFDRYTLSIDQVQGDPFASPSHISIRVPLKDAGFPSEYHKDAVNPKSPLRLPHQTVRAADKPFHIPGERFGQKRPDLCQPLRPGGPHPDRLRDHGQRDRVPVFYRIPGQRAYHQRAGTGKDPF